MISKLVCWKTVYINHQCRDSRSHDFSLDLSCSVSKWPYTSYMYMHICVYVLCMYMRVCTLYMYMHVCTLHVYACVCECVCTIYVYACMCVRVIVQTTWHWVSDLLSLYFFFRIGSLIDMELISLARLASCASASGPQVSTTYSLPSGLVFYMA